MSTPKALGCAVIAILLIAAASPGGTIYHKYDVGAGAASGSISTGAPGNDDHVGPGVENPNQLYMEKWLYKMQPFDIVFGIEECCGDSEYFVTETVVNMSERPWFDYHFELGYLYGGEFVSSGDGDFLDFDQPHPPNPTFTSSVFTSMALTGDPDMVDWWDGVVMPGQSVTFTFSIDIPDGDTLQHPLDMLEFTLRQTPTPEPGTVALTGLGLAGIGLWLLRRRRS
jgi:hypothetical protein